MMMMIVGMGGRERSCGLDGGVYFEWGMRLGLGVCVSFWLWGNGGEGGRLTVA